MATSDPKPAPATAPEARFTVSPLTLAADRWMGRLIRFGGVGVVLAVFGMLAFLIFQVFPIFCLRSVSNFLKICFKMLNFPYTIS